MICKRYWQFAIFFAKYVNMIPRPTYLKQLISWKDRHLIKIVSGVRRSGKSTLFKLYQEYLQGRGIEASNIISINLEDPVYYELLDWRKLYDFIDRKLAPKGKNYVFIDEVQNVRDFQRAADGLYKGQC